MIELVQGEGGVNVADPEYVRGLRELCDRQGLLLIFDEVQTGMGRTGKLFGYEHYDVTPDVITLAKALGGGLAMGAMLAREQVAKSFVPGSHASTFGGNPLACSVGLAVMKTLIAGGVLRNCVRMSKLFIKRLEKLRDRFSFVRGVRGKGLLIGLELEMEGAKIVEECMKEGLLLNCTAYKVLRFAPPLTITETEITRGLDILEGVLERQ
jgi:acetylornithine/succinyldiaminopimelate/putrescine aminotransferase